MKVRRRWGENYLRWIIPWSECKLWVRLNEEITRTAGCFIHKSQRYVGPLQYLPQWCNQKSKHLRCLYLNIILNARSELLECCLEQESMRGQWAEEGAGTAINTMLYHYKFIQVSSQLLTENRRNKGFTEQLLEKEVLLDKIQVTGKTITGNITPQFHLSCRREPA